MSKEYIIISIQCFVIVGLILLSLSLYGLIHGLRKRADCSEKRLDSLTQTLEDQIFPMLESASRMVESSQQMVLKVYELLPVTRNIVKDV